MLEKPSTRQQNLPARNGQQKRKKNSEYCSVCPNTKEIKCAVKLSEKNKELVHLWKLENIKKKVSNMIIKMEKKNGGSEQGFRFSPEWLWNFGYTVCS